MQNFYDNEALTAVYYPEAAAAIKAATGADRTWQRIGEWTGSGGSGVRSEFLLHILKFYARVGHRSVGKIRVNLPLRSVLCALRCAIESQIETGNAAMESGP